MLIPGSEQYLYHGKAQSLPRKDDTIGSGDCANADEPKDGQTAKL
jgi:hypothetical protein